MIWIIVGYMWLFIHRPFEVWPILGTIRLERLYMIFTLVAFLSVGEKKLTENKVNFAVAGLALAMTLSTALSPYTNLLDSSAYQDWMKYLVFYILVVTCVRSEKDLKIITVAYFCCFFIYMLHSYREFLNGRYNYAMGTVRMIGIDVTMSNPNGFGASIVIMLPSLLPVMALAKKKWHYLAMLAYFLLSVRCVQLTGSRSSFVFLGVAVVTAAAVSKRRLILLPGMVLAAFVLWATLSDNLKDRYMTLIDPTINESATQSAEGRMNGFYDGIQNFMSSPIWGVGPDCHGIACGSGFLSHCLYGQIPGELGGIGVMAFTFMVFCVFLNHFEVYGRCKYLKDHGLEKEGIYCFRVSTMVFASYLLMLIFGLSGHNGYRYTWIWLAAFQAVTLSLLNEKTEALRQKLMREAMGAAPSPRPPQSVAAAQAVQQAGS